MTTAGIGVMTWRASCSCRWKTPLSMPASPGSSLPPARAWPMRMRSSWGVAPSSAAACGSMRTTRSIVFDAWLRNDTNGFMTVVKIRSGVATSIAVRSGWTIDAIFGTCSPAVMWAAVATR